MKRNGAGKIHNNIWCQHWQYWLISSSARGLTHLWTHPFTSRNLRQWLLSKFLQRSQRKKGRSHTPILFLHYHGRKWLNLCGSLVKLAGISEGPFYKCRFLAFLHSDWFRSEEGREFSKEPSKSGMLVLVYTIVLAQQEDCHELEVNLD